MPDPRSARPDTIGVMENGRILSAASFLAFVAPAPLLAAPSDPAPPPGVEVSLGLGDLVDGQTEADSLSVGLAGTWAFHGPFAARARVLFAREFTIEVLGEPRDHPRPYVFEAGLLVGVEARPGRLLLSAGLGPALVAGGDGEDFTTAGLAFHAGAARTFRHTALGLAFSGDLNRERSLWTGNLVLRFDLW